MARAGHKDFIICILNSIIEPKLTHYLSFILYKVSCHLLQLAQGHYLDLDSVKSLCLLQPWNIVCVWVTAGDATGEVMPLVDAY